jgi:ribosomal protein S21
MVNDLIKENRRLKRQLERLVLKGGSSDAGSVERSLRSLQRRVQRAVAPVTTARRRRSTAPATATRRRRRKTADAES